MQQNGNAMREAVRAAVKRHGATREELIPILNRSKPHSWLSACRSAG